MLRQALSLIALLASSPLQAACEGPNLIAELSEADRSTLDALVASAPYPEGNLWRAEKDGTTVHVVGTIHIPDPRLERVLTKIAKPIAEADLVILESTAELQTETQRRMTQEPGLVYIVEGPTLIDRLPEEDWIKLRDRLQERGIPGFMAAKFQPWYAGLVLAIPPCAMDELASGGAGLDAMIDEEAGMAGVPLVSLDTADTIFDLFAHDPMDEQIEMLQLSLSIETDEAAMFATMLDSYFAGHHRELWEFSRLFASGLAIEEIDALFDEMEQEILIARNLRWAPMILQHLEGRDVVLAVGAAHLSGETGVLRLLEEAGYKLKPL
ncbi:MAG: TraB/GumN family protein [Rhodobacteraceae bacterium]|nr:TraB/GumN family protein [Paracoccaceae bacterium]